VTLSAPAIAGSVTVTLPSTSGVMAVGGGTITTLTTTSDITVQGVTVGRGAGAVATNTAVGASALQANTVGANNTAIGYQAGYSVIGNGPLVAVGYQAGYTYNAADDWGSVFVGWGAGKLTTGKDNIVVGGNALFTNSSGAFNTAIGAAALRSNTTASNNTAVGYRAGYTNTTGTSLTFIGQNAGYTNSTGNNNTYLGVYAGYAATASNNTFIGVSCGETITTGAHNTIIGRHNGNQSGLDIRTTNNNVVLSDGEGLPWAYFGPNAGWTFGYPATAAVPYGRINQSGSSAAGSGPITFGYANNVEVWSFGSNSNYSGSTDNTTFRVRAGTTNGVVLTSGNTSWASASDERLKDIIEPITDAAAKVSTLRAVIGKYKTDDEGKRRSFLIAQDVQSVLPEAVSQMRESAEDETEYMHIAYTDVIPLLVAAIKELKAEVDSLKSQLNGA